jgi:hypothetical protein
MIKISPKQADFIRALQSGKFMTLVLGGGANSGKTIVILAVLNEICKKFPNVRVGVFRKSDKTLRLNTIPSYRKVLKLSNTTGVEISNMIARYGNGSEMVFNWADITKDPDCDNLKGGEYTIIYFNEAPQISKKYYEIAKTRIGRWNDVKTLEGHNGRIKPMIILDFNPTYEWPREFHDMWVEKTLPPEIYYQNSTIDDNIYAPRECFEVLETLPEAEYKRYRLGEWDYLADPAQLITYEMYKNCRILKEDLNLAELGGDELLAIDPTDEGKDRTVLTYIRGCTAYEYEVLYRHDEIKTAHLAMERCTERGTKATIIDSIGVGAGCANTMAYKDFYVVKFIAGEKPITDDEFYKFKNKRAEAGWLLRKAMKDEQFFLLHTQEVQKEMLAIHYLTDDRTIQIEGKDQIRKRLGYSPDHYDSIVMGNYLCKLYENSEVFSRILNQQAEYAKTDGIADKYERENDEDVENKYRDI